MRRKHVKRARRIICFLTLRLSDWLTLRITQPTIPIQVHRIRTSNPTQVDSFWNKHTVLEHTFKSEEASLRYLDWRFEQYPLFRELMELWGEHDHKVLLDYGCGPGNDLVGFLTYTAAQKVIGIDISMKALEAAARRVALHHVNPERIQLMRTTDSDARIPLPDASVDHIFCEGVLHHTSEPEIILKEFHRVLKNGSESRVMVYNRDSLWLHLYTAYVKMILENRYAGLTVEEAFSKTTDSEGCPIARCYRPKQFIDMSEEAGFSAVFLGGYFNIMELEFLQEVGPKAVKDGRLHMEHRKFLDSLTFDQRGYPLHNGKHAGVGGVYVLHKI